MGGTLILFDTCVGSGHFFLIFELHYFFLFFIFFFFGGGGGFRNINIFWGMKIFWIFLGGHDKIGLVLGVSSMYFRVFLKVNVQNENIFAWQKFQTFFGCLIFPYRYFFGGKR